MESGSALPFAGADPTSEGRPVTPAWMKSLVDPDGPATGRPAGWYFASAMLHGVVFFATVALVFALVAAVMAHPSHPAPYTIVVPLVVGVVWLTDTGSVPLRRLLVRALSAVLVAAPVLLFVMR